MRMHPRSTPTRSHARVLGVPEVGELNYYIFVHTELCFMNRRNRNQSSVSKLYESVHLKERRAQRVESDGAFAVTCDAPSEPVASRV